MAGPTDLFHRHPDNPILTVRALPYAAGAVFNPGVTEADGETLLLMRVEGFDGRSHLTCARSRDGIKDWRVDAAPVLSPGLKAYPEEAWGVEDARITWIRERAEWVIAYTAYSECGPLVSLAMTRDFRSFRRLGPVLPPENKDAALFPRRISGRYCMLHRPVPAIPGFPAHIWISFSPDLHTWGGHQLLLTARGPGSWDAAKIGMATPPLETPAGWLILYHGVRRMGTGDVYRLGLALLDLDDPSHLIRRLDHWVLGPEAPYERMGDTPNVVFPCGWILVGDEIRLYYGAADSCIALAGASLEEVMTCLLNDSSS
ncbi:MAG: glycosidase [Deltaproteobacteria bacterium]|nr:glycosidase [Deltaproteobacteria bacterium]